MHECAYTYAQGVIQFSRSTLEERRGPIITFRNLKNIRWGFFPLLFFIFCFFRARGMGNWSQLYYSVMLLLLL